MAAEQLLQGRLDGLACDQASVLPSMRATHTPTKKRRLFSQPFSLFLHVPPKLTPMAPHVGAAALLRKTKQVSELLLDQQHQIDLLLRGQSSLRGSMNNLRRTTQEKDAKTQQLHHQLEQQHGAALRWVGPLTTCWPAQTRVVSHQAAGMLHGRGSHIEHTVLRECCVL